MTKPPDIDPSGKGTVPSFDNRDDVPVIYFDIAPAYGDLAPSTALPSVFPSSCTGVVVCVAVTAVGSTDATAISVVTTPRRAMESRSCMEGNPCVVGSPSR